jgi:hypothetical protein
MASEKDKLKKPYELPLRGAKTFRKAVVGEDGVDAELLQAAVEQEYHQVTKLLFAKLLLPGLSARALVD